MKLRYKFPPDKIVKGIRWLELEEVDGGAFVYEYEDIDSTCNWDSFYLNIEEALSGWETAGVCRSDWYEVA